MKTFEGTLIAACWLHNAFAAKIPEVVSNTPGLSTLQGLLESTGLVDVLAGDGPFTVFAPTNGAFLVLPSEIKNVLSDPDQTDAVGDLLLYHVVADMAILSTNLTLGAVVEAANGGELTVTSLDPVTINDSIVTAADIIADNGVIHVIDSVFLPPPPPLVTSAPTSSPATLPTTDPPPIGPTIPQVAATTPGLSRLLSLLQSTGLEDTLNGDGPFTVFAPYNAAFGKLPVELKMALNDPSQQDSVTDILLYHVVPSARIMSTNLTQGAEVVAANGDTLVVTSLNPPTINTYSTVITADIPASNGIIHIIDTVLLPSVSAAPLGNRIPEVLAKTPGMSRLLNLLDATGLSDTLFGEGPFTVFAPNNGAFLMLPAESKMSIKDPNRTAEVTDVLLHHVVGETIIMSSDLTLGALVPTLNGDTVEVTSLSPPTINESVIVKADIQASNGVVHIIDTVL